MRKRNKIITGAATLALMLGGGAGTAFATSNEIHLDIHGQEKTVRTFDKDVDKVLQNEGVQITRIDKVTPALTQTVPDGGTIIVEKLNPVKIIIDNGEDIKTFNTDKTTVAEAIKEAGYDPENVKINKELTDKLSNKKTTEISLITPKKITFATKNGKKTIEKSYDLTVGEALKNNIKNIEKTDRIEPGKDTKIENGMTVEITRIRNAERTEKKAIKFKTITKKDSSMYEGEKKVTVKGEKGELTKTIKDTTKDGKVVKSEVIKEKVTKKPVNKVISVGTKEKPAPVVEEAPEVEETESTPDQNTATANGASADDSNDDSTNSDNNSTKSSTTSENKVETKAQSSSSENGEGLLADIPQWKIDRFDRIAQCESTGNWHINTHNGFFGGLQHTSSTWLAFGGGKFAPRADLATREQQIYVADKVQKAQSWSAWPVCSTK